ncbi:MAG TPA: hypothetical protein VK425_00690 [Acidimicrobiales bacterium]|nr:hypothetical protein [Acidimicrobiales bacterium]
MRDRWEQAAAGTGVVAVILLITGSFVVPKMPEITASATAVQQYFLSHRSGIRVSVYFLAAAVAFFIWFLGTLRTHLRQAEGGDGRLSAVAFGAGLVFVAAAGAELLVQAALTFSVNTADVRTVQAFYDMVAASASLLAFPLIPFAGAIAVVTLRHGGLPSWLGAGFGAFALYEFVEGAAFTASTGAFAPGQALNQIGLIAFSVLVLVLSIVLIQRNQATSKARKTGTV